MTFRQLIESKGFTAITLSKASGVNIRTIHRYLELDNIGTAYQYNRRCVARALKISVKELMEAIYE